MVEQKLYELIRKDPRYPYEAYEFLCEAVSFTQDLLERTPREEDDPHTDYHVSGGELLRGACEMAVLEFGMMAPVVFRHWNIHKTDDMGNIVFNLIRSERLSKSERDDPEDFHELFDIEKVLRDGFELTTVPLKPGKGKS
jgi:uncharacterized repeat protein (TIGR04138 family)